MSALARDLPWVPFLLRSVSMPVAHGVVRSYRYVAPNSIDHKGVRYLFFSGDKVKKLLPDIEALVDFLRNLASFPRARVQH